jgi:hypothetical protein
VSAPAAGPRTQALWAAALLALAAAAAFAVDQRGHASRLSFTPPQDFQGRRWAMVEDAASAVELWAQVGVRGRRVLVATGRWGKPVTPDPAPIPPGSSAAGPPQDRAARVSGALFDATMRGLARDLVMVMPDAAFEARVAAIRPIPETTLGDGWARQPFHGIARAFYRPTTLPRLDEEVLLLVEPSFFASGSPPDLLAWLEDRGIRLDLGVIAARDPESTPAQEAAALELAARLAAVPVEVDP